MPVTLAHDASNAALYHPERRDTIFQNGRACSIPQRAVEFARLAYYRAEESTWTRERLEQTTNSVKFYLTDGQRLNLL
jgi:hypothetical protein